MNTESIQNDTPCIACGYNLRGLTDAGLCPECATAISSSLRSPLLEHADPDWLRRVAFGIKLLFYAYLVVWPPCLVAGLLLTIATRSNLPFLLGVLGASTLTLFGYLLMTVCEPESPLRDSSFSPRKLTHLLAIAAFLLILTVLLIVQANPHLPVPGVSIVVLSNLATFAAGLTYARQLALRIPDRTLAGKIHIARWGVLLTGIICSPVVDPIILPVLAAIPDNLGFILGLAAWSCLAFLLFSLVLLNELARLLRRIADRRGEPDS